MKRDFILTPSGQAASALSCVALSLLACAQAGAQVAPPQAQGPSGVRVEGAGGGVQGVRSGAPTDWVLQLKSGQISPEEAWNRGLLTASNAGRLIWSAEITGEKHRDLRLRLAGLLAERAPEVLGPRNGADRELKRVAGDYFRSQKDERAVGFLEAALEELLQERQAQMKSRTAGDVARKGDPTWITPLANLAMFYSEMGQFLKSAQTWSRAKEFSTHPAWVADTLVEAARVYLKGGDAAKAKELYDQIPQYGYGWYTALAYYDQALPLMDAGKLGEARAILSRPLGAKEQVVDGTVALNAWLASLSYREGNLEEAMRYGQLAVKAGENAAISRASVKNLYALGRDIYNRAGGWKTQPIQSDVKEFIIKTNPSQPDKPLYARFRIKTYGDMAVIATVDNPAIQVRVLPIDNWQKSGLDAHEEESEVIVQTTTNPSAKIIHLVLSSSIRGKKTIVPITFREEGN